MDAKHNQEFPFEILDLDHEVAEQRKEDINDRGFRYVRVGPNAYFLTEDYRKIALDIYTMPLKSTDIFVVGYPRSGTTWTEELVWMIANDLDFEKSREIPLRQRFHFLDNAMLMSANTKVQLVGTNVDPETESEILTEVIKSKLKAILTAASPRFIKTHLPLSLLPPLLLDSAKVVYVARDPRDVVVSFYNLMKNIIKPSIIGDFKVFWEYHIKDLQLWAPYFEQVKESWQMRHHPNMLFLFYEEISEDLPAVIRRVAEFLNKEVTDEKITELCDHLHIDKFKNNVNFNPKGGAEDNSSHEENIFIRKGKVGGWREYFNEEMMQEADRWFEKNLRGTDIVFPTINLKPS